MASFTLVLTRLKGYFNLHLKLHIFICTLVKYKGLFLLPMKANLYRVYSLLRQVARFLYRLKAASRHVIHIHPNPRPGSLQRSGHQARVPQPAPRCTHGSWLLVSEKCRHFTRVVGRSHQTRQGLLRHSPGRKVSFTLTWQRLSRVDLLNSNSNDAD